MQVLPCQDKKSGTRSLADFTLEGPLVSKPAKQLVDLVNLPLIFLTRELLYALFLVHRVPVTPSLYFSVYCVLMMIFVRLFLLFYFNFAVLRYVGTKLSWQWLLQSLRSHSQLLLIRNNQLLII